MKRAAALVAGAAVGAAIMHALTPASIAEEPPGMCLYGSFPNMETYRATDRPEHAFIDVRGNRLSGPVDVYVACNNS